MSLTMANKLYSNEKKKKFTHPFHDVICANARVMVASQQQQQKQNKTVPSTHHLGPSQTLLWGAQKKQTFISMNFE
jgi:hypothetical protein